MGKLYLYLFTSEGKGRGRDGRPLNTNSWIRDPPLPHRPAVTLTSEQERKAVKDGEKESSTQGVETDNSGVAEGPRDAK